MDAPRYAQKIIQRADRAGLDISPELADHLAAYLALLTRWNRTINLTALDVDTPADAAIDRIILEPIAASAFVRSEVRRVIDVGSGGGSPAIPMKFARPALEFVLVESKARKAAFLREAARQLRFADVDVEAARVEDLVTHQKFRASADLITVRAVRLNEQLLESCDNLMAPDGRIFWFGDSKYSSALVGGRYELIGAHQLIPDGGAFLIELVRPSTR